MVNIQMVPMKKGNVSLTDQYLKKKKTDLVTNGWTFDSVTDRHYLFIR